MSSSSTPSILTSPPLALTFDVFGTVVDWRSTVLEVLVNAAAASISSSSRSNDLPPGVRSRLASLKAEDWLRFAQEWRTSYHTFTRNFDPSSDPWRDIDTHMHTSLLTLLSAWGLSGLYTEDEAEDLSKVWHFLDAWGDSAKGLGLLNQRFTTATLSNGNGELLKDLDKHARLGFKKLMGAEDFRAYKPNEVVYRGAAEKLGVRCEEVGMVAAHLGDLKAARACGFKTIYIERPQEEEWDPSSEPYKEARSWVDIWISKEEDGLVELARRFGIVEQEAVNGDS